MTLPKKGRRSIIIDGEVYYYRIRTQRNRWDETGGNLYLTVEYPNKNVKIHNFKIKDGDAFTPKMVLNAIKEDLL